MSIGTVGQAVRLVYTRNMSNDQWKQERRRGIGGSAIAAIAGVHPYSSPFQAYLEIVGDLEPEENEAMYWGKVHEPVIAEEFKRRHPEYRVERVNAILQHPDEPIFLGNVDRRILGDKQGPGVLEIKTSSAWLAGNWRDDVPDHVTCQVQWYLGITGYSWANVAALIGGNHYEEFLIERDEEIIGYLQSIAKRFWEEHVEPKTPPDPTPIDADTVAALYPDSDGSAIDLPSEAASLVTQYREAKRVEAEAAKLREEAEVRLKVMLGVAEVGLIDDAKVTWKTVTTNRLNGQRLKAERPEIYDQYTTPSSYRRFQVR